MLEPTDLPPALLSLFRQVARDCRAPGTYTICLTIPHYPASEMEATISRLETIRIVSHQAVERQSPRRSKRL